MKQVLFILLAFISFQGFSQSVKVEEIGLEVMKEDLGEMNWKNAKKVCADLGDGWRLPTLDELKKMYEYKDEIGGFLYEGYWCSTELASIVANLIYFDKDGSVMASNKDFTFYVRAVRDLK